MDDYEYTHGFPNRFPENTLSPEEMEYETKRPPGYWEEYDRLQAEARRLANDRDAVLVMMLNGDFRVRTTAVQRGKALMRIYYGQPMRDRLEAWKTFIAFLSITTPR